MTAARGLALGVGHVEPRDGESEVDLVVARDRTGVEASECCEGGRVLGRDDGAELRHTIGTGVLGQGSEQRTGDAVPLPVVDDQRGEVRVAWTTRKSDVAHGAIIRGERGLGPAATERTAWA